MNEKGLVANLLYLNEADFGDAAKSGKATLSAGAWAQYFLDNFATVRDAVVAMANPAFAIIAPHCPMGKQQACIFHSLMRQVTPRSLNTSMANLSFITDRSSR